MEEAKSIKLSDEMVLDKIYFIRNQKVMLDSDLAKLYGVETKALKQAVKRNIDRFPEDFMFELSGQEFEILRSQIVTSSWGGVRYMPMAFTEYGVLMLSSVLNSQKAIQINIQIMRVFARIRKAFTDTTELKLAIEGLKKKTENDSKNIELVFKYLDELLEKREKPAPRKSIGYKV
ncbi:MAG: ORF6N domain-containing protein [Bacteroidia bacterium]|nr:ORF6N domain-containing protein [Bacteroidia bacterium]